MLRALSFAWESGQFKRASPGILRLCSTNFAGDFGDPPSPNFDSARRVNSPNVFLAIGSSALKATGPPTLLAARTFSGFILRIVCVINRSSGAFYPTGTRSVPAKTP